MMAAVISSASAASQSGSAGGSTPPTRRSIGTNSPVHMPPGFQPANTSTRSSNGNGATAPILPSGPSIPAPLNATALPASIAATTQIPLDPFRGAQLLSRCSSRNPIYRFPHADMNIEHSSRAEEVFNIFRLAVRRSKVASRWPHRQRLKDFSGPRLITYERAMCGPSITEARPSIIVTYPKGLDLRLLRREFEEIGDTKYQYAADLTPGPSFILYYCWAHVPLTPRWRPITVVPPTLGDIESEDVTSSSLTLCGTALYSLNTGSQSSSSSATLACLLEIKGKYYALSSAHPFLDPTNDAKFLKELLETENVEEESEIIFEDEENDSGFESATSEGEGGRATWSTHTDATASPQTVKEKSSGRLSDFGDSSVILLDPEDLGSDRRDCDWALTPIIKPDQLLPNAYTCDPDAPSLCYITRVACELPKNRVYEIVVHIITRSAIKVGTLLPGSVNISGLSGRESCNAWIVSMNDGCEVVDGDSGSLVVDASTRLAYGHVVATGPQGDAYLVPLRDTIQQVQTLFETTDVRLPDNLWLLTELSVSYITAKQTIHARSAVIALADLVQQSCQNLEWRRLARWVDTCAARSTLMEMLDAKLTTMFVGSEEQLLLVRKRLMARHVLLERLRVEGLSHVPSHAFTLRKDFRSFLEILLAHYLLEEQSSREISSTTRRSFFGQRTARRHHEEGALWMWELLNAFDTLWTNKHQCRNKHRTRTLLTWSVIRSSPLVPCEHFSVCDVPMYSEEVSTPLFINYFEDPWTSCNIGHKSLIKACNRERLADGGFATVYRITLPATSMTSATSGARQYALKEISRKTTPFRRWRNEEKILKLLGKVKNPHIINLVCSDYTPEDYLLLFPLADCDLDQLMEHDLPASPSLSTWVLKQVLGITEALECIHAGDSTTRAYVSHGDLKPDNILWLPQDTGTKARVDPTKGRLVIADFGLAQIHSTTTKECPLAKASNCNLTRERTQPDRQYAAPEVELATSSEADYRASDVFSLGCVLLELLVWLLEGPRGRRVLRESLCSDAPGDATSFWRVEMTTNSLTFSLKSQVQACLELLLERKHSNATLQTAIDFMVYGSPLDPNPTSRPTAAEVRSLLSVIESGKLHKPLSIRREEPVWARTWVATPSQSQRRGSLAADEETSSDDASKKSYTSSTLDMHVEARPQLCGIDREHANLAVKNAHFKQKCPFCNSEGRPVALKYHIRAQHRTRQPYRCSSCEWLFGSKGQLVRHRRSFESCTPTRWLAMPNVVHKYRRSFLQTVNTKGRTLKRARESDDAEESLEPDGKRSRQAKKRKLAPVNDFPSMRSGGVKRYPKDDDWSGGPSSSNVC